MSPTRAITGLFALSVALAAPPSLAAMSWQDAVARLAQERTQAETCAAVIKARGAPADRERAAMGYGAAKAEVDGVIAGLVVLLARDGGPAELGDLLPRLERAAAGRDRLCRSAQGLIPADPGARGGVVAEIVGAVLGPLVDAVKDLIVDGRERDAAARRTIQTRLEATAWTAFSDLAPASF